MWRRALVRPGRVLTSSKIAGAVQSGDQVNMYKVRFLPRLTTFSKIALYSMVGSGCYLVWDKLLDIPLSKLDHPDFDMPAGAEQESSGPLFFPFPFTVKEARPLPYSGKEEEWQNFIKFNKDQKLKERVKNDLKMLVKRACEANPRTKKWAKDNESYKLGPTWLVLSFPERPPPEFVRTGIELNARGFEIKSKKVDPRTKAVMDRVLMPYPIASASYAFIKAMTIQHVSAAASYIGLSTGGNSFNTSNPDPEIEKTIKKLQARQTAGNTPPPSQTSESAAAKPSETPAPKTAPTQLYSTQARSSPSAEDKAMAKNIPEFLTLAGTGPWAEFKNTYKRTWRPVRCLPPRGSLAIHGMVSLESPKGRVYVDVFAWYHPKEDKFHMESLDMNLRAITPYNQKPLR